MPPAKRVAMRPNDRTYRSDMSYAQFSQPFALRGKEKRVRVSELTEANVPVLPLFLAVRVSRSNTQSSASELSEAALYVRERSRALLQHRLRCPGEA